MVEKNQYERGDKLDHEMRNVHLTTIMFLALVSMFFTTRPLGLALNTWLPYDEII